MDAVSIVIVNWNTGKLLQRCLESLAALPEKTRIRHIVVIDNASEDSSVDHAQDIASTLPCIILRQGNNLGFAKANNIGIAYIHQHGGEHDHILLLNPDTSVDAHAIEHMVQIFEKDAKAGIVGARLRDGAGKLQPSVRRFPTFSIFLLLFLKLHRIFPRIGAWNNYMMSDFDYSREQKVDQVMGAAFLIRNILLAALGDLDESFWIWFEEVDYCKRAHDAGWNIVYTPEATIMHYGGVSFNQLSGLTKTRPFLASSLVYAQKHLGVLAYGTLQALYPLAILIASAARLV